MPSRKLVPLVLPDVERASLEALSRKRTASQALAELARIVLACAEQGGVMPLTRVAERTGVSRESVRKWRSRFLDGRTGALADAARPGAPRKITDEQVEMLVTRTLAEKGRGRDTHWSTRAMAAETGLSQSSVSRIWRAFGLKPHVVQTWKLSTDPEFIAKVRDVVGLYMSPPEHALVLAVDEKSQIQALDRTAPCLPILPTTPERRTHDYVRHGTTSLFAAYDLASGSVIAQHYRRHRHQEFLRFLKLIDSAVPRGLDLHLVLDNYATHKTPAIRDWLIRHPRVPPPLHPDQLVLAEPRRAVVRRADQPQAPPLRPPQRPGARDRHPPVDQRVEQEPQAVQLDQDRPAAETVYGALLPLASAPTGPAAHGGNQDPTGPFRRPLLAPPRQRQGPAGSGQLTDEDADALMASVKALLDGDRPAEAIRMLEDGLERAGRDPFLALRLRHFLGAALFYAGEYTRAAALLDAAGRDYRRYLPPDDRNVLDCAYHAGHAYAETGQPDKALAQLRFYVQNATAKADSDEEDRVLESRFVIAQMLAAAGYPDEALAEFRAVRPLLADAFGDHSTQVRNLDKQIGRWAHADPG